MFWSILFSEEIGYKKINNLQQISSVVQATMLAQFFSVDCFNDLEHNPETNFIDFGCNV